MDIVVTKIVVAFLFGLVRLFFGLLPIKLYSLLRLWENDGEGGGLINERRHQQVKCYLSLCQSFGGGVLFATCLLHMMPDVQDSVEELQKYGESPSDYPYSQLIVCCGFFLVYFVEEVSHWLLSKVPDESCDQAEANHGYNVITKLLLPGVNRVTPKAKDEKNGKAFIIEDYDEDDISVTKLSEISDSQSVSSDVARENEKNAEMVSGSSPETNGKIDRTKQLEKAIEVEVKTQQQVLRIILVILALSLHAIFEGLAIGLQASVSNIWYLFTAISIHSAIILFCISLELLLAKIKIKTIVVQVLVLSVTSPFGVLLGLLITLHANMNTKAKSTAMVLLEGLSAGTILYITFFEVLNREKQRRVYRMKRAACILAGFALMAFLESVEIYH